MNTTFLHLRPVMLSLTVCLLAAGSHAAPLTAGDAIELTGT